MSQPKRAFVRGPVSLAVALIASACGADEAPSLQAHASALVAPDVIPHVSPPPPLDGSDDGVWGDNAYTQGCPNVILGNRTDPNDYACRWLVVYDEQALYVYVDTADDVLVTRALLPWERDSVELYVDADGSRGHHYDGRNDFEYIFAVDQQRIDFGVASLRRSHGIEYTSTLQTPGRAGYTLRIAIPWATLGVTPTPGAHIGLDLQYNDNDNGLYRDGKVAGFATTDDAWWDPNSFGLFTLGDPAAQ